MANTAAVRDTTVALSGDGPESKIVNVQVNTDKPFMQIYVQMGDARTCMLFENQDGEIRLVSKT